VAEEKRGCSALHFGAFFKKFEEGLIDLRAVVIV